MLEKKRQMINFIAEDFLNDFILFCKDPAGRYLKCCCIQDQKDKAVKVAILFFSEGNVGTERLGQLSFDENNKDKYEFDD